jgi:hypothetical protein
VYCKTISYLFRLISYLYTIEQPSSVCIAKTISYLFRLITYLYKISPINHFTDTNVRASLWSYGNQTYLYNQCLSPTSFVIYFPLMARPTWNRCDHQDITDILFKVVLKHPTPNPVIMPCFTFFVNDLLKMYWDFEVHLKKKLNIIAACQKSK